jgi:hypothetical protein
MRKTTKRTDTNKKTPSRKQQPAKATAADQAPESLDVMVGRAQDNGRYLVAAFRLEADGTVRLEWRSQDFRHRDYRVAVSLLRDELARDLTSSVNAVHGETDQAGG